MLTCQFCGRDDLSNLQSLYAHLKHCKPYKKHKMERAAASLGQAVPKGGSRQAISAPARPTLWPDPPDPLAQLRPLLEQLGVPTPPPADETPEQRRRRLLQMAKRQAVDQYWWFPGTVTAQMRAEAKLAIDRELRNEPLEEWTPQEVMSVAEGIRDRLYATVLQAQEKAARRKRELEDRKRTDEAEEIQKARERKKKKAAYLEEAGRRTTVLLKSRSLHLVERLSVWEDIQMQLDAVLTGAESPVEAYATMEALLQARVAEWNASDEAMQAQRYEEWGEVAIVLAGILALGFLYVKAPQVLAWILQVLSPQHAKPSPDAGEPRTDTGPSPAHEQRVHRRVKRMGRSPYAPPPEPPSPPSNSESTPVAF